ncbi:MAG: pilus assembly protein TadG-related protein [Isosphaeraceae bacterium]
MRTYELARPRRGAVLPMMAISAIVLLGFVALAIDVGMIATARCQCQNAADAAAMAGARALNGDGTNSYNVSGVTPAAMAIAKANKVNGKALDASNLSLATGSYTYDYSQSGFVPNIPASASDTPNLVQATVNYTGKNLFAPIFGVGGYNISVVATAAHRPRDVALILDLSGSMRFDSLLCVPYSGSRTQSNNPDGAYPTFGHYSSTSLDLQNTSGPNTISGNTYGLANTSMTTDAGSPIVLDYSQGALGSYVAAFTAAPSSYATNPAGDKPLYKYNSTTTFGATVQEITNGATFNGYANPPFTGYTGPTVPAFAGYTQGPGYWGKTFFIWPPDPNAAKDWRTLYFTYPGNPSKGVDSNTMLWDTSFNWRAPGSSSYNINYTAILAWIKKTPCPFPTQLRAGRILYYDSIPSTINTGSNPPSDMNQRFWKQYIDYVLGVYQTGSTSYDIITKYTGYGDDITWGTRSITAKPTGTGAKYMSYTDNPKRPILHFWFGPLSMVDFLANYNLTGQYSAWDFYDPGNSHVGPLWACKLGIQSAMLDVKNNHPNDFVAMMFFNVPSYSSGDGGTFNRVRVPLGRNYQRIQDTLWYPPTTIDNPGTEIRMYSTDNGDVPRSSGGTTPVMGFMQAYNQFSGNTALRSWAPSPAPQGEAGGLGRRGAQRLVILETDGMANTMASANFTNSGAYNSYYNIRYPGEFPASSGSSVTSQLYAVASQICALDTASPPGYSTARKPVLIHCIGEGPVFDPAGGSPDMASALSLLQNLQYIGSTQGSASTPLASYKIIIGTSDERMAAIRQAISTIMQDGIQVSLIR